MKSKSERKKRQLNVYVPDEVFDFVYNKSNDFDVSYSQVISSCIQKVILQESEDDYFDPRITHLEFEIKNRKS